MKTVLKFAALVLVVTIAFMIVSAVVPYSEGLRTALETANETADGSVLLFLLLNKAWLCLAIWYVVVKSPLGETQTCLIIDWSAISGLFFYDPN